MAVDWQDALRRWVDSGLIDPDTADAIERWEAAQPRLTPGPRLRAPILICVALGAVLLAAGVLLFVAAHWDALPPGGRFTLVLGLVVGLHGLAAWIAPRFPALSVALHAVGSIALGAGIFLVGQIFNLQTHWPAGLLLWTIAAGLGWLVLRQWPQLALLALLAPAWLVSEWQWLSSRPEVASCIRGWNAAQAPSAGLLLLSLAYLSAPRGPVAGPARRVLLWLGGLTLGPAALCWVVVRKFGNEDSFARIRGLQVLGQDSGPALLALLVGWGTAIGAPLLLGWWLRGRAFWPLAVAAGWILAGLSIGTEMNPGSTIAIHVWGGIGGILLVAWGLRDSRSERINFGIGLMAFTLLSFYCIEVIAKLDRSLSLIGLGVLCLAGGWALERLRRRLLGRLRPAALESQATLPGKGQP
jgi:hypothetical protein